MTCSALTLTVLSFLSDTWAAYSLTVLSHPLPFARLLYNILTRGVTGALHSCLLLNSSSDYILRVLRALRGEFPLTSVRCEPKLDVTTHSKRQGTL
jgi:hypothetical protein